MRALVLTSSSLRHQYFIKKIYDNFDLVGVLQEDKGAYYKVQKEESELIESHFAKLKETEEHFFLKELENMNLSNLEIKKIKKNEINNAAYVDWAKSLNVDVIFLFGTGILRDIWLDSYPDKIINLHLGLSPFYRGSATLFWPFVNNELECLGATIHIAAKKVDSGGILARIKPNIESSDNYYSINYKTIKSAIDQLSKVSLAYLNDDLTVLKQDISESKVYKKSDFNELSLTKVIEKFGEGLSDDILKTIKESSKCNC